MHDLQHIFKATMTTSFHSCGNSLTLKKNRQNVLESPRLTIQVQHTRCGGVFNSNFSVV